jgi:hypothetical protein
MLPGSRSISMRRLLTVVAVLGLIAGLSVVPVLGNTGTGSQNPDVTVTITVSPNTVHYGQTETATGTAKNNTSNTITFTDKVVVKDPSGSVVFSKSEMDTIAGGATFTKTIKQTIPLFSPTGNYTVIVSSKDTKGTSTARTHFNVQP